MRIPFIAGNWKMFKTTKEAVDFAKDFNKLYANTDVKAAICGPYTQLEALKKAFKGTDVGVGAQNVHFEDEGAFTGEISAKMLKEIGVDYCLVGHSERRQYFAESDETVNKKIYKLFSYDITPIFCVGETLEERDAGKEVEVVKNQITLGLKDLAGDLVKNIVVAYEPVWAIGTGRTATKEQANDMCLTIRDIIQGIYGEDVSEEVIIQYGGSVKPENATEILGMEDIDGALVGGASLKPEDFIQIVNF